MPKTSPSDQDPPLPQSLIERIKDPRVKLVDVLKEVGFEGLSNERRLEIIESASLEDYMMAIDLIHNKVAPESSAEIHAEAVKIIDPNTGEARGLTALPDERPVIMSYALTAAQRVAEKYRREGGSLEDTLQRCGNLAAFGVVLAHNYLDGNGRTARTIGQLVQNGCNESDPESVPDLEIVSTNRPRGGFRINSYVPRGEWNDRANKEWRPFLDIVAGLEEPLDGTSYGISASRVFTTPFMA